MRLPAWLQFLIATGLFGACCWDSSKRMPDYYPGTQCCQDAPMKYDGHQVWIGPSRVLETSDSGFVVLSQKRQVRVHSSLRPTVDSFVMLIGTFHSDGSVTAISTLANPHYELERAGIYLISAFVLVAFAKAFLRRFEWRGGLRPRG